MQYPFRAKLTDSQMIQLGERSLRVVGDLVCVENGEFRWLDGADLSIPWLNDITCEIDLPEDAVASRLGQCWVVTSESGVIPQGAIIEFLGKGDGDNCVVREWLPILPYTGESRQQRFIKGEALSRGSGSNQMALWSDIFGKGKLAKRIILSDFYRVKINEEDEEDPKGSLRVGRFEYGQFEQPTPVRRSVSANEAAPWLTEMTSKGAGIGEYDIFTDGTFDKELEPVAFLLDHENKTISGAAVVIAGTGTGWESNPILALRIKNDERVVATSAFPLELLAIVAGLRIARDLTGRRKIITDCESALKLINSSEKLNYWSNKANVALVKAAIALGGAESTVEHAHSHPESRLHKTRWTRNDNGNFIADRVAAGDYASLFEYNQLEIVETSTFEIITELASIQTWFIASDEGVINLSPLVELAQANEAKLYLKERDVWHHKRLGKTETPIDAFWSDRTLQHAATIWELEKADAKCTARAQRIIFDKHWHSWNQAKGDSEIDTTCELCGDVDSLKHMLVECQHSHGKEIRDECLATIRYDLSYNVNTGSRDFAELLYALLLEDPDRHCMYTGLWTLGLRTRLGESMRQLNTTFTKKRLEEWKKMLVRTGQTLTIAARSINGLRFQEQDEPPMHTAMTFKERVAEARKDKLARRSERAKKSKKALLRKKCRLTELGLVNKNPLESEESIILVGSDESVLANECSESLLDSLLDLLDLDFSQYEHTNSSIGGVT